MNKVLKKAIACTLAASMIVTGAGLSSTTNAAAKAKKAKSITLNCKSITLKVGAKKTIKVKSVKPKKANKKVTFKSANKKIATVSAKGVVKGIKAGKTTIKVTSKSNKKLVKKIKVTVKKADVVTTTAPVVTTVPATTAAVTTAAVATTAPAAPVATTAAPVATTVAPVATTAAPVATTEAPAATTEAPAATTEAPAATTEAPAATTAAPAATTAAPVATTAAPVLPVATTEVTSKKTEEFPSGTADVYEVTSESNLVISKSGTNEVSLSAEAVTTLLGENVSTESVESKLDDLVSGDVDSLTTTAGNVTEIVTKNADGTNDVAISGAGSNIDGNYNVTAEGKDGDYTIKINSTSDGSLGVSSRDLSGTVIKISTSGDMTDITTSYNGNSYEVCIFADKTTKTVSEVTVYKNNEKIYDVTVSDKKISIAALQTYVSENDIKLFQ